MLPYVDHVPAEIELYPDQADLMQRVGFDGGAAGAPELAVLHEARSGASRALLMLAVRIAYEQPGARVLVLGRDISTMRDNWAGREDGLWAFAAPFIAAGAARRDAWYLGFISRDSRVVFRTFADAGQVREATHVLIDDADEMELSQFHVLRDRALSRNPLPGEAADAVRLIAVAPIDGAGWPAAELRAIERERAVVEMRGKGMPLEVRSRGVRLVAQTEPLGLRECILRAEPGYRMHYHSELLILAGQLALDREVDQLWISVPPGYGKSWVVSAAIPCCALVNDPASRALVVAATDELAGNHTDRARIWYRALGGRVRRDSRYIWSTAAGGSYEGKGKKSSILSLRGDVVVFDDPFGSIIEASRQRAQREAWEVWEGLQTRLQIHGHRPPVRILMHQRLHRYDVAGRALDEERERASGERIAYFNLPAIKRRSSIVVPATVIDMGELDTREEGLALAPDLKGQSLDRLRRLEERNPPRFRTIMQGDPLEQVDGAMFDRGHLVEIDPPPLEDFDLLVRSWDLATSDKARADASASVLLGHLKKPIEQLDSEGRRIGKPVSWVVLHATNRRVPAQHVYAGIREVAGGDGQHIVVVLPQDPGVGKIVYQSFANQLAEDGFAVQRGVVGSTEGGKRQRATALSGAVDPGTGLETGSVAIVRHRRGSALEELVDQLAAFTGDDAGDGEGLDPMVESGRLHDDLVDALSQAFNWLAKHVGWS